MDHGLGGLGTIDPGLTMEVAELEAKAQTPGPVFLLHVPALLQVPIPEKLTLVNSEEINSLT